MPNLDLDAIEARANAATPGPWFSVHTDDPSHMNAHYVGTRDRGDCHDNVVGMDGSRAGETIAITLLQSPDLAAHDGEQWRENTDFIAHARGDVPALLAEVRRLQADLDAALVLAEDRQVRLMFAGLEDPPDGWRLLGGYSDGSGYGLAWTGVLTVACALTLHGTFGVYAKERHGTFKRVLDLPFDTAALQAGGAP